MLGICNMASFIPENKTSNYDKKNKFQISDDFIENKLGVRSVSRIGQNQNASDLCKMAFENLMSQKLPLDPGDTDVIIVCTQNPDYNLPHTSAIVHGKLNLPEKCAAFDISIGCSGYVYALAVIESLMKSHGMKNGLLCTADPYSKIIDEDDKNTALLFGDAATVTYIGQDPVLSSGNFSFRTRGRDYNYLICNYCSKFK